MKILSVVIPVLNEQQLIGELVKQVKINVEKITPNYEIILVDDGSIDGTWNEISKVANSESRIKGIKLSRNFGQHYAITAGINYSDSEWVVVMDGDMQDKPENIPKLFEKIQEGFDIVFVSRRNRNEKILYKLLQKVFYKILKTLSGIEFDSAQANFSIINRKVVEAFNKFPEHGIFYGSTIRWLGFSRTHISADQGTRLLGKPSYTIKKRLSLAMDIILAFSDRPLKIGILLGLSISLTSIMAAGYVVMRKIYFGYSIVGWASIMVALFFLIGIVLSVLGIISLYVGRIFQEVKNRPLYIVQDNINIE
jgi:glycosyltransferase involved in cell wall biosynthesis